MLKNPKFSIITISFNSVKTIEKTILSVLGQTYKDFEYIIIDGGSTDGTLDIIKKYQDKFSYFISEKDKGISDAFNKGILVSKGEIIGIVNSDDWYEIDALEKIARLDLESRKDFYVGALKYWDGDRLKKIVYPDIKYSRFITFRMPHLNHPASFFTKKFYNEIGLFNLNYKYAMDYDIFLRAFLGGRKGYLTNDIISNMLCGGVANINNKKAYQEVFKISKNKFLGFIWYILSLIRVKYLEISKQ